MQNLDTLILNIISFHKLFWSDLFITFVILACLILTYPGIFNTCDDQKWIGIHQQCFTIGKNNSHKFTRFIKRHLANFERENLLRGNIFPAFEIPNDDESFVICGVKQGFVRMKTKGFYFKRIWVFFIFLGSSHFIQMIRDVSEEFIQWMF